MKNSVIKSIKKVLPGYFCDWIRDKFKDIRTESGYESKFLSVSLNKIMTWNKDA